MSRATKRARWELELGVVDVPNLADHSFQPSEYSGYLCQFCQRSSWSHGQRTLGGWTPQLTFREHTGDKDWPSCVGATAYAAGIAWAKHVRAIKPFVYVPPKPYKFVPPSKQTIPGAAEFKRAYKAHLAANGPLVCPVEDWHVSAWTMPKRSRWQDCEMRLPAPPLHWTNRGGGSMSTVVTECRDCASWVPWEDHLPTCSRPCDRRMPSWSDHAASCPTCYYGTWKLGKDVTAEVSNLFACPVRLSAGLNDAYVRLGANQPLDMVRLDVVAWLAALALERALSAPPLFVGEPVACDGRVTFEVLVAGDRPPLECVARLAGSAVHLMLAGEDEA